MARALGAARQSLIQALVDRHPEEVAAVLETARVADAVKFLHRQTPGRTVAVLRHLTPQTAADVVVAMDADPTREVLRELSPHRAAAMLARMDAEPREACLAVLDQALAEELRALAEYPPETAGSLMDPRVTAFRPDDTVGKVVRRLRALGNKRVQDVFLVDEEGRLKGSVAVQDLVLASSAESLGHFVKTPPAGVQVTAPRASVMEVVTHHAGSVPVIDFDGRLVGVLRQDELIEAVQEKAAGDLLTMVGASKEERALSTPFFVVRKRLPWLQVNLATAFLAAAVVALFSGAIEKNVFLATLLPVAAGQSGNTGAQALAVTMRGLALREVRTRHWRQIAIKELAASCLNGVAVAIAAAAVAGIWSGSSGIAIVTAIAMVISMMAAALAGVSIPVVLTALRQDPAQSSSIILTTVTDIAGFASFLGIATMLQSLL